MNNAAARPRTAAPASDLMLLVRMLADAVASGDATFEGALASASYMDPAEGPALLALELGYHGLDVWDRI